MSAFTWPPDPSAAPRFKPTAAEPVASAVLVRPLPRRRPHPCRPDPPPRGPAQARRRDLLPRRAPRPGDADLAETALREAEEEIGLPRSQVGLIGELPPTSTFATGYLIHPFVATIPAGVAWELLGEGGRRGARAPLSARCAPGARITTLERRGITFQTDAYVVDDHLIWGATARIIEHLLARLADDPGEPLAIRSA